MNGDSSSKILCEEKATTKTQAKAALKESWSVVRGSKKVAKKLCDIATKCQSEFTEKGFYEIETSEIPMGVHVVCTLQGLKREVILGQGSIYMET